MTKKACVVMTTAPDRKTAETLAQAVLEARAAACAQLQAISSLYWWDGKIAHADEQLILFKTAASCYADIERIILSLHPYDTPEIIQIPVEAGLSGYLAWIERETRSP